MQDLTGNLQAKYLTSLSKYAKMLGQKTKVASDTHFDAASFVVESLQNFIPFSGSGNIDLSQAARSVIIPRCREMFDNDLLAKGAINRIVEGAIGKSGLIGRSRIDTSLDLGLDREIIELIEGKFTRAWKRWGRKENCDITGRQNLDDLLRSIMQGILVDGDILVNTVDYNYFPGEEFSLKLQVIEGERVSNPSLEIDTPPIDGKMGKIQGIKYHKFGKPFSFFVRGSHPGDSIYISDSWTWDEVDIYQNGERRAFFLSPYGRVGQFRGVPMLAVALEKLKTIKQYSRSELFAAAITSLYTVFVKNIRSDEDGNHNIDELQNVSVPGVSNRTVKMGAGTIQYLNEGEEITTADPTRPNSAYEAFVMSQIKEVGAGLGIPYECLLLVFNSSYTAARASFLALDTTVQRHRKMIVNNLLESVYFLVIKEFVLKNVDFFSKFLNIDAFLEDPEYRDCISGVEFVGDKMGSLDEVKDVQASGLRIDKGLSSRSNEIKVLNVGSDFDKVTEELGREGKLRKELGLGELATPGVVTSTVAIPTPGDVKDQKNEEVEQN